MDIPIIVLGIMSIVAGSFCVLYLLSSRDYRKLVAKLRVQQQQLEDAQDIVRCRERELKQRGEELDAAVKELDAAKLAIAKAEAKAKALEVKERASIPESAAQTRLALLERNKELIEAQDQLAIAKVNCETMRAEIKHLEAIVQKVQDEAGKLRAQRETSWQRESRVNR